MDERTAVICIRRGDGWNVRLNAEAMDGRKVHVTYGGPVDLPRYEGEGLWIIDRADCMPGEPIWMAEGDLQFV